MYRPLKESYSPVGYTTSALWLRLCPCTHATRRSTVSHTGIHHALSLTSAEPQKRHCGSFSEGLAVPMKSSGPQGSHTELPWCAPVLFFCGGRAESAEPPLACLAAATWAASDGANGECDFGQLVSSEIGTVVIGATHGRCQCFQDCGVFGVTQHLSTGKVCKRGRPLWCPAVWGMAP